MSPIKEEKVLLRNIKPIISTGRAFICEHKGAQWSVCRGEWVEMNEWMNGTLQAEPEALRIFDIALIRETKVERRCKVCFQAHFCTHTGCVKCILTLRALQKIQFSSHELKTVKRLLGPINSFHVSVSGRPASTLSICLRDQVFLMMAVLLFKHKHWDCYAYVCEIVAFTSRKRTSKERKKM